MGHKKVQTENMPKYHVITRVDGIERARTYQRSINDLYRDFGDKIVRFIPLDRLAWAEIHEIGESVPDEEVYVHGIID